MPDPRSAPARRSAAARPVRHAASLRVRRRRALALVIVAFLLILVVTFRPSGSKHSATSVRPNSPTTKRAASAQAATQLVTATASWQLSAAVSRAVAFSDSSGITLVGGLDGGQSTVSSVIHIDPATGASTSVGSLAVATHDAAGGVLGGRRFIFGGGAQHVSDVVQQLQPNGQSTVVAHLPQPRADLAAATVGSNIYLLGGYDGTSATRDILATSDGTTFRTVAQLPVGVRYPAVVAVGTKVFVFGGELNGSESSAVQEFDTASGSARLVGGLPGPRTEAAALTVGGSVYVAGGLANGNASSDVLAFDPATLRFTSDVPLPTSVADAAVASVGDVAYLLGGEASSISSSVITMRKIAPPTGTSAASGASVRPFAGKLLIADRGNDRLIIIDSSKHRSWVYPSASMPPPAGGFYFPDDAFFADHGRSIVTNQEENHTIVRIAYPSGALQWTYGHPKIAGSGPGFLNQPDDAFLLKDGTYVVADALNCRILHISAAGSPLSQIGTTGNCVHDPPRSVGYPNGDTPLADGNLLVSEIHGSWISEYTLSGTLVWTVHLPITYPSDPQQLGPDLYLVSDYARPGGILEFTREGRIVWTYRPASGEGMLDHPSLAERLPNGLIAVNDDYRHRVAFIDPATSTIVWQYGQTDHPGTGIDQLNTPDGFDLMLPDGSVPEHPTTG